MLLRRTSKSHAISNLPVVRFFWAGLARCATDQAGEHAKDLEMSSKVGFKSMLQAIALRRWVAAGPLALLTSLAILAAMPHWFPEGEGKVDNLVIPVIAFPLIWSICFLYACLSDNVTRVAGVLAAIFGLQVALIGLGLLVKSHG
jgi:hypothetical protein